MSTLSEIQEAIQGLHQEEQEALTVWLNSKNLPPLNPGETQDLLATLDQAVISLENGEGVSLEKAHRLVGSWIGKYYFHRRHSPTSLPWYATSRRRILSRRNGSATHSLTEC